MQPLETLRALESLEALERLEPLDTLAVVRTRRAPGRRDELLAAALAVIRRDGPGASMDDMAAAAGITKPVLYRYFDDRDGLIAAVGERFAGEFVARLSTALAESARQDPEARIRSAIAAYVAFIEEDPALYAFLTSQAPPDSAASIAVIDRIAGVIEEEMRATFEAQGLDTRSTETWAHAIVGMVHLTGARWAREAARGGAITRTQLIDDLVALAAYGMTGAIRPVT